MTELGTGPWEHAFAVDLPVKLRSKSNYRKGKKGWSDLAMFEQVTQATLLKDRPEGWVLGEKADAVKDRPVVVIAVAASSMVDSTNFTKSIADAAEGVLVLNDASISASGTLGVRKKTDQKCTVAFAQLPAGADMEKQAAALSALVTRLPALFNEE